MYGLQDIASGQNNMRSVGRDIKSGDGNASFVSRALGRQVAGFGSAKRLKGSGRVGWVSYARLGRQDCLPRAFLNAWRQSSGFGLSRSMPFRA